MMFKDKYIHKLYAFALAAVFALTLAGCGGGGGGTAAAPDPDPPPMPTAYQQAVAAIAAAETAEAAQAAYDAVDEDAISGAESQKLRTALANKLETLATAMREADQKKALMDAAGNVDTSDLPDADAIAAAKIAIAALKAALAAAADVSDADKAMYESRVTAAETAVAAAQSTLDHAAQTTALTSAVEALQAIDLTDLSTQEKIDAAQAAIDALQTALAAATELSAAEKTEAMTELATADRTVMTAQGRFNTAAQKVALAEAVATLAALNLDNLMTQAQIDAAVAAITGVQLALDAATNLTDAEKLNATVDMTVAQRKVDRAETALAGNVGRQRTALTEAGTALADIDLDDLDTQEKIAAANNAVNALKAALDGATHLSDSEKATYQTQLNAATETVRTAQTGMDRDGRRTAQRTAITNAVTMATTAVNGVKNTSTDSEVSAAEQAIADLETAIAGAEDLPEGDTNVASARGTVAALKAQLSTAKTARTAYLATKSKDDMKKMAKLGKDMHAALGPPTGTNVNALNNIAQPTLSSTGLAVVASTAAGALTNTATLPSVTLKAGDSVSALGGWAGTDYAHTNTGTKVVNEARVYNNKGPGKTVSLADAEITVHTEATAGDNIKGYYTVDESADLAKIMAPAFTHSARQTHTKARSRDDAVYIRGTFNGAPGEYRCDGSTADCTSTNDGKGSPSALGGVWHFKPDAGAMVHQPDANYLYYGWWVNKDKDGVPKAASAFTGFVGTIPALTTAPNELTGSATYSGNAAGKFAINPLDGTGSGGHFTADVELTAKFGAVATVPTAGMSGTIDNFMANGESVPWSVALHRAPWDTAVSGVFETPLNDAPDTADVDESKGTTWSIDGNSAPRSGTWGGTVYDEKPGGAPDDDGSTLPTTVTGTFYSEFSNIGRMVGAFGAEKQ